MADFTIDGRTAGIKKDIQRNWLWELQIQKPQNVGNWVEDDLLIRCRSVVIPGRGNEPIESNFMGQKKFYPGKPTYPNTFVAMFEEFEDKVVSKSLYSWQQSIHDYSGETTNPGGSSSGNTKGITSTGYLKQYGFNNNLIQTIAFEGIWIQNVDDISMDYTGAESVKYSVTFQYNYWKIV